MATFNMIHNFIDCILVEILGLLFLSLKQLQVVKHFRHKIYSDHEGGDATFSLATWEGRTMIHRFITSAFLALKNGSGYICDVIVRVGMIIMIDIIDEKISKSWLKIQNKIFHSRNPRRLSSCTRTRTKAALSGW